MYEGVQRGWPRMRLSWVYVVLCSVLGLHCSQLYRVCSVTGGGAVLLSKPHTQLHLNVVQPHLFALVTCHLVFVLCHNPLRPRPNGSPLLQ